MPILLRVALGLFGIGLVAIIAIFATPLLTDSHPGLPLYLLAMLAPVGFAVGMIHALRQGRRSR
jgi:hypothetical protein